MPPAKKEAAGCQVSEYVFAWYDAETVSIDGADTPRLLPAGREGRRAPDLWQAHAHGWLSNRRHLARRSWAATGLGRQETDSACPRAVADLGCENPRRIAHRALGDVRRRLHVCGRYVREHGSSSTSRGFFSRVTRVPRTRTRARHTVCPAGRRGCCEPVEESQSTNSPSASSGDCWVGP